MGPLQKISADYGPDDRSHDGASEEIREPVDGDGDAEAYIERVEEGGGAQYRTCREKRAEGEGDGESHGGMRRRPAPENTVFEEAEIEIVADVGRSDIGIELGLHSPRECLIERREEPP